MVININIFFKPILMPDHAPVPIDMDGDEKELEDIFQERKQIQQI